MSEPTSNSTSGETSKRHTLCTCCGAQAVVRGIAIVNDKVSVNEPLCENCYTPFDELRLPSGCNREKVAEKADPKLITTPADDVIVRGDVAIIRHGPGNESRIKF